ncbi:F-box/WD repeat-containing protein 7 [Plakobranchus ocellatus]|uniref:F-box/WD repeat-containing protein 7 n=1 Tax=Plakobranchus ocellatus TaxID=259542 RepID=A0AAV4C8D4_9GAST|nr:F-box/WD repeat-containing protein 7 [Plakobranchus ocellatus]
MDGRVDQEKQLARLNSSASVSDLSEALSDMSLSTSPGSGDVIAQEIKSLPSNPSYDRHDKTAEEEVSTPPVMPRKRLVVRQLSSNPYLASAEMSPSDDHPLIVGSHSYAAGESRFYHNSDDFSEKESVDLYNRSNSYPLTSDCVEETDGEDEEEEEDDEGEVKTKISHTVGDLANKLWNCNLGQRSNSGDSENFEYSDLNDLNFKSKFSKIERDNGDRKEGSQTRCTNAPTSVAISTSPPGFVESNEHDNDYMPVNGHNHKQERQNSSYQCSFQSSPRQQHHQYQQQRYYGQLHHNNVHQSALNQQPLSQANHKPNSECMLGSSRSKRNGHTNQKNCSVSESFNKEADATSSCSDSHAINKQQSRILEVNAWGHFYRQHEHHYKYRRSHYSSDSEDETAPHPYSNGKGYHSKQARAQYHQHHCRHPAQQRSRQHSPSQHKDNVSNTSQAMQTTVDPAEGSHPGLKPIEFRDRFQTVKRWFSECNDGQKNLVLKGLLTPADLLAEAEVHEAKQHYIFASEGKKRSERSKHSHSSSSSEKSKPNQEELDITVIKEQFQSLMALAPVVEEIKSAYDAYNDSIQHSELDQDDSAHYVTLPSELGLNGAIRQRSCQDAPSHFSEMIYNNKRPRSLNKGSDHCIILTSALGLNDAISHPLEMTLNMSCQGAPSHPSEMTYSNKMPRPSATEARRKMLIPRS